MPKKTPFSKPRNQLTGKTPLLNFRCSIANKEEIQRQATMHGLTVSEYVLRKALQRRVDAKLETAMILELRDCVAAIRELHATYEKHGHPPPYEQLVPVLNESIAAIQALGRY